MNMEQRRAAHAWKCAREASQKLGSGGKGDKYKDYVNAAKGMPALIMNSGLMQVLAYNEGKKEERYALLSRHLRDWLHETHGTHKDFIGFMEFLHKADPSQFQAINSEAFAWLRWLRQMAPAVALEQES